MNTTTPRTDKLYSDHIQEPLQSIGDLAAIMHNQCERFERELTAVTEQRDETRDTVESLTTTAFDLLTALENARNERDEAREELKAVTEQRDEALSDLQFRRDLYSLQTKQLDDAREQRDRLLEQQEQWRLSSVCRELVEQRDRLAEALINCMPFISGEGCGEYSDATEALQSLKQDHFPDVGNMIGTTTTEP